MKPIKLSYRGDIKVIKYITDCINWLLDFIVVNPQDEPTEVLRKLEIDGTVYELQSGGSSIEANPEGSPTDTLIKLEIDGVIYGIEGGGGGITKNYNITDGQISSNDYMTAYFDVPLTLGEVYYIEFKNDVGGEVLKQDIFSFTQENMTLTEASVSPTISNLSVEITSTSIKSTFYSGPWQDIFVDIYTLSGGSASNLSDLSDVKLTNLSDGQILQYNSTSEKWENADNQGDSSLPFDIVVDPIDNGVNIVYEDSILSGGQ